MVQHLFNNFLTNEAAYKQAQAHWHALWDLVSKFDRDEFHWTTPWFSSSTIERDGNPIFTAISIREMKALRIIQHEPTSSDVEVGWWLDTFNGCATDPLAIRELVISCAPSAESDQIVSRLVSTWV